MRGQLYCVAHRGGDPEHRSDPADEHARRTMAFAAAIDENRQEIEDGLTAAIAAGGDDLGLRTEIGSLRLLLHRLVIVDLLDGDAISVALSVAQTVDAIVELVRAERAIGGSQADAVAAAVDRLLQEVGR